VDHRALGRECRLRRRVGKQGCALRANRTRDPDRPGHGGYMIIDRANETPILGHNFHFPCQVDRAKKRRLVGDRGGETPTHKHYTGQHYWS
jgi:hypothetical protein